MSFAIGIGIGLPFGGKADTSPRIAPALLLANGTNRLLLVDGSSKLSLAG